MYFLSWIIIGLVAGWSAGKILKGNGYSPLMDIAIGIVGAVAGGFLMRSAGFSGYQGRMASRLLRGQVKRIGISGRVAFNWLPRRQPELSLWARRADRTPAKIWQSLARIRAAVR